MVELRPVLEHDLGLLERFLTDPEAMGPFEWHGYGDTRRWRRQWAEGGLIDDDGGMLAVARDDSVLGMVTWRKVVTSRTSWCWNIGVALLPDARGYGYGTQAQRLLAQYLFAHTPAERVEAGSEAANAGEQRALEKAGFTREATLRSYSFRGGQWRDVVLYSVLRNEMALDEA